MKNIIVRSFNIFLLSALFFIFGLTSCSYNNSSSEYFSSEHISSNQDSSNSSTENEIYIGENGNWYINGTDTGVSSKGEDGQVGIEGKDGLSLHTGNGQPAFELGNIGDSYIDLDSWHYYVKGEEDWELKGALSGSNSLISNGTMGLEYYPLNDTECAVGVGTAKYLKKIEIPATYNGFKVTEIVDYGFSNCERLTDIIIPEGVKTIGQYAFEGCENLVNVSLPNSLTMIDIYSFKNCSSLTKIVIPDNVIRVGSYSFDSCTSLESVILPDALTSIESFVFGNCINLNEVEIKNNVKKIHTCAFYQCNNLQNIVIPSSVNEIQEDAFLQCDNLMKVINLSELDIKAFDSTYGGIASNAYVFTTNDFESDEYIEQVIKYAGDTLWELYGGIDEEKYKDIIEVVNCLQIADETIDISWNVMDENNIVNVESYDEYTVINQIYELDSYETIDISLAPTISFKDLDYTFDDIYQDEKYKTFDFYFSKCNSYSEWENDIYDVYNIKGIVVDVCRNNNSVAGSIYILDDKGHGYYAYNPSSYNAEIGDIVVVSGEKNYYKGQEEFAEGSTYEIIGKGDLKTINFIDATNDWMNASSNEPSGTLGQRYQNTPIKLTSCRPTRISGLNYYFTVGSGSVEYSIYNNNYVLNTEDADAWTKTFEKALSSGETLSIIGIGIVYNNVYQVYSCSLKPYVVEIEEDLTLQQKYKNVTEIIDSQIKQAYEYDEVIKFKFPSYVYVDFNLVNETDSSLVLIENNKIKVRPTLVEKTIELVAVLYIDDQIYNYSFEINTLPNLSIINKNLSLSSKSLLDHDGLSVLYDTVKKVKYVNGYEIEYLKVGDYGNGLQFKYDNNVGSYIANITPFENGISYIEFDLSDTISINKGSLTFEFSNSRDFKDSEKIDVNIDSEIHYIVQPNNYYKYFRITWTYKNTGYFNSINIIYN